VQVLRPISRPHTLSRECAPDIDGTAQKLDSVWTEFVGHRRFDFGRRRWQRRPSTSLGTTLSHVDGSSSS
jgi:hypothetical protein